MGAPYGWLLGVAAGLSLARFSEAFLVLHAENTGFAHTLIPSVAVVLWGLHMGLTQSLLYALVADVTSPKLRGTAFRVFHLITGVGTLSASFIVGLLWEGYGPMVTFLAGAGFAALSLTTHSYHGHKSSLTF